ncbi:MAG: N-acetyltransferase [Euryarchaeota archaeon]|nr:N-acetyltransferase [Euryarchaeota archaeon]
MEYYAHPTAEVSEKAKIGKGTRIWHQAQVREGAVLGENCNIGKGVYIDFDVKIGSGVKIQNYVSVYHGVEIGDDVFIGPAATFTNDKHPRAWLWDDSRLCHTKVHRGVSIGANATIVCGTEIGEYAMIAAGAVVTKDVPPHGLVVGVPAKLIGFVCECGEKLDENFKCPVCGKEYPELKKYAKEVNK